MFTSCASLYCTRQREGRAETGGAVTKANGEIVVNVVNASALINTTICVKDGTPSRDVTVQQGENSSSGTLVMQFESGAVFEMCTPMDTNCRIGMFLPADQDTEDVFDDLSTQLKDANLLVADDSSTGTCCVCTTFKHTLRLILFRRGSCDRMRKVPYLEKGAAQKVRNG